MAKRSHRMRFKRKDGKGCIGINPAITTIILIAIAVLAALMVTGQLQFAKPEPLQIKYQGSYIYTMGNSTNIILSVVNNDGKITIDKITVETDTGEVDASNVNPTTIDATTKSTTITAVVNGDFGAKTSYKVVIQYKDSAGNQHVAIAEIPYKG